MNNKKSFLRTLGYSRLRRTAHKGNRPQGTRARRLYRHLPLGTDIAALEGYKAIILSGGPSSVWAAGAPKYDEKISLSGSDARHMLRNAAYLRALRGVVKPSFRTEYGQTEITVDTSCPLFDGLEEKQLVLMSHGDAVAKLPDGFKLCAKTGEAAAVVWSKEKT